VINVPNRAPAVGSGPILRSVFGVMIVLGAELAQFSAKKMTDLSRF
jgi:hypothetical protein